MQQWQKKTVLLPSCLQQTFRLISEIVTYEGPVVVVGLNASHVGPQAGAAAAAAAAA